jgi:hypothetical protein
MVLSSDETGCSSGCGVRGLDRCQVRRPFIGTVVTLPVARRSPAVLVFEVEGTGITRLKKAW